MTEVAGLLQSDIPVLSCQDAEDEAAMMGRFFYALFQPSSNGANEQEQEEFIKAA